MQSAKYNLKIAELNGARYSDETNLRGAAEISLFDRESADYASDQINLMTRDFSIK
jgi:hypothetical protein